MMVDAANMTLPMHWQAQLNALLDRLRDAATPQGAMDAVGQATLAMVGPGLLTINAWHVRTGEIERLWSSDSAAYPVGGKKIKGDTAWTRQSLVRVGGFVGEGDEALAAGSDDIAVIRGVGLNGVVSVPLRPRRAVRGTGVACTPLAPLRVVLRAAGRAAGPQPRCAARNALAARSSFPGRPPPRPPGAAPRPRPADEH